MKYSKAKKKSWWVYILECKDKTLYTGSTNDLERRLKDHNDSKIGAKYTRARRPVVLVYKEECGTIGKARSRELQIKSWRKEKRLALIQGSPSSRTRSRLHQDYGGQAE